MLVAPRDIKIPCGCGPSETSCSCAAIRAGLPSRASRALSWRPRRDCHRRIRIRARAGQAGVALAGLRNDGRRGGGRDPGRGARRRRAGRAQRLAGLRAAGRVRRRNLRLGPGAGRRRRRGRRLQLLLDRAAPHLPRGRSVQPLGAAVAADHRRRGERHRRAIAAAGVRGADRGGPGDGAAVPGAHAGRRDLPPGHRRLLRRGRQPAVPRAGRRAAGGTAGVHRPRRGGRRAGRSRRATPRGAGPIPWARRTSTSGRW